MRDLLGMIEASDLPTPAPIEQRWTRSSRAGMSPAASKSDNDLFCWVGIIMYLPTQDEAQRAAITRSLKPCSTCSPASAAGQSVLTQLQAFCMHVAQTVLAVQRPLSREALAHIRRPSALGED